MNTLLILLTLGILALLTAALAPAFRKTHRAKTVRLHGVVRSCFRRLSPARVEFANIGEGTREHGIKSFLPDAGTSARYLLYKIGATNNSVAITGAGDIPLGCSDDVADAGNLDLPIAVKLFGAVKGTVRIVSDGTLTNGCKVTTGANGQGTLAVTTNLIIGVCLIDSDLNGTGIAAAGDVVELIPMLPTKAPF